MRMRGVSGEDRDDEKAEDVSDGDGDGEFDKDRHFVLWPV